MEDSINLNRDFTEESADKRSIEDQGRATLNKDSQISILEHDIYVKNEKIVKLEAHIAEMDLKMYRLKDEAERREKVGREERDNLMKKLVEKDHQISNRS